MARIIRDYRPEDEPAVRALHERLNDPFPFPDLSSPVFAVKKVVEVDGQVTDVVLLRATASVTIWPGTDYDKLQHDEQLSLMRELQNQTLLSAWAAGMEDVFMFCPMHDPEAERLEALGWMRLLAFPTYYHNTVVESASLKAVV